MEGRYGVNGYLWVAVIMAAVPIAVVLTVMWVIDKTVVIALAVIVLFVVVLTWLVMKGFAYS